MPEIALEGTEVRFVRTLARANRWTPVAVTLFLGAMYLRDRTGGDRGWGPMEWMWIVYPLLWVFSAGGDMAGSKKDARKRWLIGMVSAVLVGGWCGELFRRCVIAGQWGYGWPYLLMVVLGLANIAGLIAMRRIYPLLVEHHVHRVSPPGALPFAALAYPAAEWCATANLSGLIWFIAGLFWVLVTTEGAFGSVDVPTLVNLAAIAGVLAGGAALLVSRYWILGGLRERTNRVQHGLWLAAGAGPFVGVICYYAGAVGMVAGTTWPMRVGVFVLPLLVPAFNGVVLIIVGQVFSLRTELRLVERALIVPRDERPEADALESLERRRDVIRGLLGAAAPEPELSPEPAPETSGTASPPNDNAANDL